MNLDVETVRAEAVTLRKLLESLLPEYRITRSDVAVEASASDVLRAFWDVIGYSTTFRPFVQSPDAAASRNEVEQILTGWRAPAKRVSPIDRLKSLLAPRVEPIRPAQLPSRYRFVGVSPRWDAFYITDESGAASDPPVQIITREPPSIRRLHSSYLARTVHALLEKGFNVSGAEFSTTPPLEGTKPLPHLAPHLHQLADGVYRLTAPAERDAGASGRVQDKIGFASWDRLCEYVHDAKITSLGHFHTTNGCFVPVKADMKDALLAASRLRRFERESDDGTQVEYVGWVADMPAWITPEAGSEAITGVSVSNDNRDRLLAWIDQTNAKLADAEGH